MILKSITFRGFTTFRDTTTVDFEALPAGVYAIQGDNGVGKTTALELFGPGILYHRFPSRKPHHIHNYIDKDRGAEATMLFLAGGEHYKATLKITPKGKKTAILIRLRTSGGHVDLVTGKSSVFVDKITSMFGPLKANLASVFGQQGGGGGFEAMEKADRKGLFRWYLGLGDAERYHKAVKARLEAIDVGAIELTERRLAEAREECAGVEDEVAEATATLREAIEAHRTASTHHEELLKDTPLAEQAGRLAAAKEEAETAFRLIEELEGKLEESPEVFDTDTAEQEERVEVLQELIKAAEEAEESCEQAVRSYDDLVSHKESLEEDVQLLEEVPCTEYEDCRSCKFIARAGASAIELLAIGPKIEKARDTARSIQGLAKAAIRSGDQAEDEFDELRTEIRQLRQLERDQHDERVEWARDEERLTAAIAEAERAVEVMDAESDGLPFNDDGEVDHAKIPSLVDLDRARRGLEDADEMLDGAREEERDASVRLEVVRARVKALEEQLEQRLSKAENLRSLQLLERALGPVGFPIYEIDAAGPDASAIINDLLSVCYGKRFRVAIRTLAPKKRGGFKEDFDFAVDDREDDSDEDRTIGMISGGEKTIVGEAMRIGFALYQAGKTPTPYRFDTMFRDEAEGSLSPSNARRYVRMLARARALGEFHHIFFVTHNEYAAASANGIIRVNTGGKIEIIKGAV